MLMHLKNDHGEYLDSAGAITTDARYARIYDIPLLTDGINCPDGFYPVSILEGGNDSDPRLRVAAEEQ